MHDATAAIAALRRLSSQQVIDLTIINAAVSHATGEGHEGSFNVARAVLAVNLDGAIATTEGVLPAMRRRGAGQIAIVDSLSAYLGLPITPTYCASTAGSATPARSPWRSRPRPECKLPRSPLNIPTTR